MSTNEIGGYPTTWFVTPPPKYVICGICYDVLKNPHQCKNGHCFCFTCVTAALKAHEECPLCKTSLSANTLNCNMAIREMVDDLMVKCNCEGSGMPPSADVCSWTGKLTERDTHTSYCQLQVVDCPLFSHDSCFECSGKVIRKNLPSHLFKNQEQNCLVISSLTNKLSQNLEEIKQLKAKAVMSGFDVSVDGGGELYCGEISNTNHRHGVGFTKDTYDNYQYCGDFESNEAHGFGVEKHRDEVYSGEFKNDNRNGHGVLKAAGKLLYVGDWKDGLTEGRGVYYRKDGSGVYTGEFKGGKCHGHGTLKYANGAVYEGDWTNGKQHGNGKMDNADGSSYEGQWQYKHKHGLGTEILSKGDVFECQYISGRKHGPGKHTYTNGTIFEGEWVEGKKHGAGSLVFLNGKKKKIEYNMGVEVK